MIPAPASLTILDTADDLDQPRQQSGSDGCRAGFDLSDAD